MRISDWSSDVCSSDLSRAQTGEEGTSIKCNMMQACSSPRCGGHGRWLSPCRARSWSPGWPLQQRGSRRMRSEEHTSELQSLMRISYAVFCLKKKKNNTTKPESIRRAYTTLRLIIYTY